MAHSKHTIISLKRERSDDELPATSAADGSPVNAPAIAQPRVSVEAVLRLWGPSHKVVPPDNPSTRASTEDRSSTRGVALPHGVDAVAEDAMAVNDAVGLLMCQHVAPLVDDAMMCMLTNLPSDTRVLVVDVETTGFQSDRSIVEIAAVELRGTTRTGVLFHRLINAERSAMVDCVSKGDPAPAPLQHHPMARKCHAISAADERNGEDAAVVMREFMRFCTGAAWCTGAGDDHGATFAAAQEGARCQWPTVVAHNAQFDVPTINAHLTRYLHLHETQLIPMPSDPSSRRGDAVVVESVVDEGDGARGSSRETICTMRLFRRMYPKQRSYGLDHVARFFGVKEGLDRDVAGHHGALIDANITARIFQALVSVVVD